MPAQGGEAVLVTRHRGNEPFESPDGKYVYYHKANSHIGSIWRIPVGGGQEEQVVDHVPAGYWAVLVKGIYFVNPKVMPLAIEFYSFDTRQVRKLTTVEKSPGWTSPGFAVSPDGRWILYAQVDQEGSDSMLVENFR